MYCTSCIESCIMLLVTVFKNHLVDPEKYIEVRYCLFSTLVSCQEVDIIISYAYLFPFFDNLSSKGHVRSHCAFNNGDINQRVQIIYLGQDQNDFTS